MPADFPAQTAGAKQITPEVTWAQRSNKTEEEKNFIYLTISVPDVPTKDMKLDLKSSGLSFTGHSDTKKATYHIDMEFFADIDPEKSKVNHSARDVEMRLQKKELKEEYWPRLLKDSSKRHWLKTDFDKWVDEDEQEGAPDDEMMNQFGGGGMPGMGEGGFGGLDFSKLGGGMGGMPDMGAMGDMGGEDEEGDEDDEDMPELEDEKGVPKAEGTASASSAGEAGSGASATKTGKIEEVE